MQEEIETYHVRSPILDAFIAEVKGIVDAEPDRAMTVQRLRPVFARLLNDQHWLPQEFREPDRSGGMGGGIGNYLIYRSPQRDLSLMSLVVPAGAGTPVHDHLAWGLVGLYEGDQEEVVYRRLDAPSGSETADLAETEQRRLGAGEFYELLPPEGDIHSVRTVGDRPSVSLHLLGNDIGCAWRHRYEPHEHRVFPFRSGYSNEECPEAS